MADSCKDLTPARQVLALDSSSPTVAHPGRGAVRLCRVAQAIDAVLRDQELLRERFARLVRDFIDNERKTYCLRERGGFPGNSLWASLEVFSFSRWASF